MTMTTGKENIFAERYIRQTLATFAVNILMFSHGIGLGWITPVLFNMQFNSKESMLGVTISAEEISWIGALLSIGGLIGNATAGLLLANIGRRKTLLVLPAGHVCFWLITHLVQSTSPYHFYAGRIFCGITGGGCFGSIPIFISEISSPNVRGRLGSLFLVTLNTGMLIGFIVTSYLPALTVPVTCGCLLLSYYFVMITYIKDTPQYLLKIGKIDEAKKSLQFYWNSKDVKDVELENYFNTLRNTIASPEVKEIIEENTEKEETIWKLFWKPKNIKASLIGLGLVSTNQFSGAFSIINYATAILEQSEGFQMDTISSTILLGLLQILGTYSATLTVDRFGRKIVLLISASGTAIGLLTAGIFDYLTYEFIELKDYSWVLVLALSSVIYLANMGVCTVCYIVLVEIIPIRVKPVATSMCLVISSMLSFTQLKVFPILLEYTGFYGLMWTFGSLMTFGFLFIAIFVPETKGKSLTE